jgi:small conductance mechanosensitive channel
MKNKGAFSGRLIAAAGLFWLALASFQAVAQEEPLEPLPEDVVAQFEQELEAIAAQQADLAIIDRRIGQREGVMEEVMIARRDLIWTTMVQNTVDLARGVAAQRDLNRDVSAYWDPMVEELSGLPDQIRDAIARLERRVLVPESDLELKDFVIADQKLFADVRQQHELFRAIVTYVGAAADFGLDATDEREFIVAELDDHAANTSGFLLVAQKDLDTLQAAAVTLPNDADVQAWISVTRTRIAMTADALQRTVDLMGVLDLETRLYRQQLLTATGEITADVLDVGIVAGLVADWTAAATQTIAAEGPGMLFRGLLIVVILYVFWQLGKLVHKGVERALNSARVNLSTLLRKMIVSTARNTVVFVGVLIAISQFGISLGPLLAGLGIAGFIIGFALQDTLSNFASGMMILFYRPFDVGDLVDAGGVSGKVSSMSLVNTTFMTLDNQRLIVPNNLIWQSVITNVTAQRVRRVDLLFGISYEDDSDKAETILRDIVDAHEAVLDTPEPMIHLHELGESSVNFIVRPWVKTDDYWDTYWDITKAVKKRFDEEGISIPYPQRDIHIIEKA